MMPTTTTATNHAGQENIDRLHIKQGAGSQRDGCHKSGGQTEPVVDVGEVIPASG